jgi:hypothetical protein
MTAGNDTTPGKKFSDLTGKTIDFLEVLRLDHRESRKNGPGQINYWLCQCRCGSPPIVLTGRRLTEESCNSRAHSCGCHEFLWDCPLSPPQVMYLAGLFDGEGTVCMHRSKPTPRLSGAHTYNITVGLGMTTPLVTTLANEVGLGHVWVRKAQSEKWKDCWVWSMSQAVAGKFLKVLTPHLRLKQEQGRVALEYLKMAFHPHHRSYCADPTYVERIESYYQRMKILNKRGPNSAESAS